MWSDKKKLQFMEAIKMNLILRKFVYEYWYPVIKWKKQKDT